MIESAREFVYVDVPLQRGDGIDTVEQTIRQEIDALDDAVLKVTLMAAEEDVPTPELTKEEDGDDEGTEPAVQERVPVGPIENLGTELGALVTRVSDRRDLLEGQREYEAVEFADVDAAVEKRRQNITVTEAADQFLEMALDTDQFTDTDMADAAEETVTALLEKESPDAFHLNTDNHDDGTQPGTTSPAPEPATPNSSSTEDDDKEEMLEDALEDLTD